MGSAIMFFGLLRLLGKHLSYFAHNVVDSLGFIKAHLGIQKKLLYSCVEICIPLYYKLLNLVINRFVALDQSITQRLAGLIGSEQNIVTSPLWIEPTFPTQKKRQNSRKKLGFSDKDLVVIVFGFVTSYKGVDWIVNALRDVKTIEGRTLKIVIAGGKAPSQLGKAHYEKFYSSIERIVASSSHATLTGFIPEEKISTYFTAADLAILPYRGMLGASASWANALMYGVPTLLSKDLQAYLQAPDVQLALNQTEIDTDSMLFPRNKLALSNKLSALIVNKELSKLSIISKQIALNRSPEQRLDEERWTLYASQQASRPVEWSRVTPALESYQQN
jgi:glycosyltransferase involved in cell wall biosynthesis